MNNKIPAICPKCLRDNRMAMLRGRENFYDMTIRYICSCGLELMKIPSYQYELVKVELLSKGDTNKAINQYKMDKVEY